MISSKRYKFSRKAKTAHNEDVGFIKITPNNTKNID